MYQAITSFIFHTVPHFISTLAPPLTVENILRAVHCVQGLAWRKLGRNLFPTDHKSFTEKEYPKLNEIVRRYKSDDDRLRGVIEYWLRGDGLDTNPSWRALILRLDKANETRAADNIRDFAEPLPGKPYDPIIFLYSISHHATERAGVCDE